MSKLIGKWIANNAIVSSHIATSVAGNGITGGGGSALAAQADGGTLSVGASGIKVTAAGITETELNTSVAGNGIDGGGGSALSVDVDSETGGNIQPANLTANGVGLDVNAIAGTNLEADGSANLRIAATAAGAGLAGGGASALSVNVDGSSIEIDIDTLQVKAGGITNTMLAGSIALTKLAEDVIQADGGQAFTAAQSMGSNKLTNLTDGADANDAVNKGQLDSAVSGLTWKAPIDVFNLIGNLTIVNINGLSPSAGDAYLATDAGTPTAGTSDALVAGDIAEYDGTQWKKIVSAAGGYAPIGTRAILSTTVALVAPYTDATDDGKIVDFTGASNTGVDTSEAVEGNAVLVVDANNVSIYDDLGYVFEGTVATGLWIQFTGAGQINAGDGLTKSGNTLNVGSGNGITVGADTVSIDVDSETGGNIQPANLTANGVGVDIAAIAGTGVEADGSANLRLAAQGNGLSGGAGSTLSVDADSETGGNTQPVSVAANGVGVDISAIAGTGIEADGSANLRLATQGTGIAGGNGSTLSFDATAADGNGLSGSGAVLTVDPDSETGGNIQPVNLTANGVGLDINAIAGTGIKADGSANLQIDTSATLDFASGGGVVSVTTQSQSDGSTKAASTAYVDTAVSGMSTENQKQEMHKITAGEVTAGYFTLASAPVNAQSVRVTVVTGPMQVSKQVVGATGVTPDFDVLSTSQVHFNNAGAATGLSADLGVDDVVIVEYEA